MAKKERIWTLMARKLAGDASPAELEELQQLLHEFPDAGYSVQILEDLWRSDREQEAEGAVADDAYARHFTKLKGMMEAGNAEHRYLPVPVWRPRRRLSIAERVGLMGDMFRNFLVTSGRSLARNKVFSLINISGLAIGMAGAILLLLWIQNELSFDQFHTKKDRIYQVYNRAMFDGRLDCWGVTPIVLAPVLKADYPMIEDVVRVNWVGAFVFSVGDTHLETSGYITDPGFLAMFDFPLVSGNAGTALKEPHSIVLTEKMARKLFGSANAMGKVIKVDSIAHFTVTGVLKNLPNNTQWDFEYLIPWSYMPEVKWGGTNWDDNNVRTCVLLKPGVSEQTANDLIRNVTQSHAPDVRNELFLHPMSKWRLYSNFENGKISGGLITLVKLLGVIAVFILLIACINYMNLSTARSAGRAREVGIRKVVGSGKGSLVGRFLGESLLMSALAAVLALGIAALTLHWFNELINKSLKIPYGNPWFWLSGVGFVLLTGLLAGSYPAFYLSSFRPVMVLKGAFKATNALITPRKALVILQFTFAIAFIICTIIIYRQIAFISHRDIGYDPDRIAYVYIKGDTKKNYPLIRAALLESGAITGLTRTNAPITEIWNNEDDFTWEGKDPGIRTSFVENNADNDLTSTLGLTLLAGRDFNDRAWPTDSLAVMINESAVKVLGFKDPLGKTIRKSGVALHIIGVIRNFVAGSPYQALYPMIFLHRRDQYSTIDFRLDERHSDKANLEKIGAIFRKYNPDYPFIAYGAREAYDHKFQSEKNVGTLASLFAGLTIFIACLGLFALAACMAENRVKEIGIRKVLGASVTGITTMLSKDFLVLVMIAFLIASPIAWWCMDKWLQDFPLHIGIGWTVFLLTGFLSALIATVTVGYQAVKSAMASPLMALRSE